MKFYTSVFPTFTSAPGVNFEIYLSGCKGHCEKCHSPHTHDFDAGSEIDDNFLKDLSGDIAYYGRRGLIDNIIILGGEPLDQDPDELTRFLIAMKSVADEYSLKIWLYTHYELDEMEGLGFETIILNYFDFIKTGSYQESLDPIKNQTTQVELASSNQRFYKKMNRPGFTVEWEELL